MAVVQKWGWNKDIPRLTKLKEFVAGRPALQEILKEVIQAESDDPENNSHLHTHKNTGHQ